ncbi:Alpha-1,2-fucosyltransferase-like protein [Candidatus Planktophila sulfonica]|uniref:Alpha-1,2-fucosyltransferase-like protein n=1 Tax=Candidatus Planktophila sulfonica TaxID=1884904 RepID=A0A249KEY8_9ACTN|nr:alpha-1,2-fucosyltransferase [Candidatus Planktophila sulfonica]ASY15370.1 Alpha-1,2-fucosyltransferase-like protein [Candidatus Planktophila sulfonica]
MPEKVVYVSGSGGLGNQIHSLHAAYCAAIHGQSRIIFLLPRKKRRSLRLREESLSTFDLGNSIDCPIVMISPKGLNLIRWAGIKLRLRLMIKFNFVIDVPTTSELIPFMSAHCALNKSIHLGGHYENSKIPVKARLLGFPQEFSLRSPGASFEQLKSAFRSPERKPIIGLHVRLGDFRDWQNGSFLLDASYYKERLIRALGKYPNADVWIFSDEPNVAASFVGDISPVKVISEDFELTNAEELSLLANSDLIIASHGTFSWWSCFWKERQENIYYPDPALCLSEWVDVNLVKH